VAHGLEDPAALLRREAARAAGAQGCLHLVAVALADEAWVVRQAAAAASRDVGREAVALLLPFLRSDPSPEVRVAAASSLLELAPHDPLTLDALVATLEEDEPRVREEVVARLPSLPGKEAARALLRALHREVAFERPRPAVLFRLFLALRRVTRVDPGYVPGASRDALRRLVARAERTVAETP
jgi:HEAT repeat protein